MTADELSAVAGVVLSLLFSYIPGVADLYERLDGVQNRLVMGALLVVVAGAAFGLSCGGVIDAVVCDKAGALGLVTALILVLAGWDPSEAILHLRARRSPHVLCNDHFVRWLVREAPAAISAGAQPQQRSDQGPASGRIA